jgi:uncharacterized protein YoxC
MLAFSYGNLAYAALAVFLLLVGLGFAWVSLKLGGTLQSLSALIKGTQEEALPVVAKVGVTVDHVNAQMEKVDKITDSAVDAADSADTAVRAVSLAVTRPVTKIAGLAAAISHGAADLKVNHSWHSAVEAAKAAAATREQELIEELRDAGESP